MLINIYEIFFFCYFIIFIFIIIFIYYLKNILFLFF